MNFSEIQRSECTVNWDTSGPRFSFFPPSIPTCLLFFLVLSYSSGWGRVVSLAKVCWQGHSSPASWRGGFLSCYQMWEAVASGFQCIRMRFNRKIDPHTALAPCLSLSSSPRSAWGLALSLNVGLTTWHLGSSQQVPGSVLSRSLRKYRENRHMHAHMH